MSEIVKDPRTRNSAQAGPEQSHQPGLEEQAEFGGAAAFFRKVVSGLILSAALIEPDGPVANQSLETAATASKSAVAGEVDSQPEIVPRTIQDLSEGDAKLIVERFMRRGIKASLEPEAGRASSYIEKQALEHKVQRLTAREILEQVAQVANNNADTRSEYARSCLSEIHTMLASPEFRVAVAAVRKVDPECQSPLGEIAREWSAGGFASLEVFLHTFQSRDFREYLQQLREHVDVDIHSNIGQLVSAYSRNQVAGDSQSAARMIEAVKRLREAVPDVTIHSAEDLRTLAIRIPARGFSVAGLEQDKFHEWLGDLRRISEVVHRVAPGTDLPLVGLDYHETVIPNLERLALPEAQRLITFIRDGYPTLELRVDSAGRLAFSDEGLFKKYVEPIVDHLKVDGPTLDQFLGLFGRDISQVDLRALAEDRGQVFGLDIPAVLDKRDEFVRFLGDTFSQYPALQEQVDASSIRLLVGAFNNYETYRELNELVPSNGKRPVLSLNYADDKIEIAKVLRATDFRDVVINDEAFEGVSGAQIRAALSTLQSDPVAAFQRYQDISSIWHTGEMKLRDVLELLTVEDQDLQLLLDEGSKLLVDEIADKYYGDAIPKTSDLGALITEVPKIVRNGNLLSNPDLVRFIETYGFPRGSNYDKQSWGGMIRQLNDLAYYWEDGVPHVGEYAQAAALLEGRYGFTLADVGAALIRNGSMRAKPTFIRTQLDALNNPSVEKAFHFLDPANLRALGLRGSSEGLLEDMLTPVERLNLAKQVIGIEQVSDTIKRSCELGVLVDNPESLLDLLRDCLENEEWRAALRDDGFCRFAQRVKDHFYHGVFDRSQRDNDPRLYQQVKDRPDLERLLFSEEFKDAGTYIGATFRVATLQPNSLGALLEVCRDLDLNVFQQKLESLYADGETLSAHDAFLVADTVRDTSLMKRLSDRTALEEVLSQRFRQAEPSPREDIDELEGIPKITDRTPPDARRRFEQQREEVLSVHRGRPDLSQIPSVQLLRIALIVEMLDRDDTQQYLGRLIAKDVANKRTELGGTIRLSQSAGYLEEVRSTAQVDGNYGNSLNGRFTGSLAGFHLHSRNVDETPFSGPSSTDADSVKLNCDLDVVFTAMGHPKDETGQIMPHRLRVNADCYFTVDGTVVIVDLGTYTVPYNTLLAN